MFDAMIIFTKNKSFMKYHNAFLLIPVKITLLLCCCFFFSSCLKNKDSTGNGPKSQVAITNFVVNASINVILDNTALSAVPLGFGEGVSTGMGGYIPLGSGLHNLKLSSNSNVITDNTISITSGINYSFFIYDTLQNNRVKTLLLTDDLTAIDTVARARFLQFIPGADTLTLTLKKDTTYTITDTYLGNKKTEVSTVAFSYALRPGSYQVTLQRKGVAIFQQAGFTATAGKLYSFIAKGIVGGTGNYKEVVSVVQHN